MLKTAFPLTGEQSLFPYPLTAPYNNDTNVLFEGYGAATPAGADRATDVLLARSLLPDRSSEDEFFALDRQVRDTLYGGYDRTGNARATTTSRASLVARRRWASPSSSCRRWRVPRRARSERSKSRARSLRSPRNCAAAWWARQVGPGAQGPGGMGAPAFFAGRVESDARRSQPRPITTAYLTDIVLSHRVD